MFKYTKALCRKIPKTIIDNGIRMRKETIPLNYENAVFWHDRYVKSLQRLGLQVTVIDTDETAPDCVFIEDTAVIAGDTVLISYPGAKSRQHEIQPIKDYFQNQTNKKIIETNGNARIDGGDVIFTNYEFFVGQSSRTNEEGFETLQKAFPNFPAYKIPVTGTLHLKTIMSMAYEDVIIAGSSDGASLALEEILRQTKRKLSVIRTSEDDAANVVSVNGTILCRAPEEIPLSYGQLEKLSIPKIPLSGIELEKVDGSLTCCSLLFS